MRGLCLAVGAAGAVIALAACDEEATETPFLPETVTPAATATAVPVLTPASLATIGSYDDPYDFRSFGLQLASAIDTSDAQFFVDNSTFQEVSCEMMGIPGPPESCAAFLDPRCDKSDPAYDPQFASTAPCPVYQPPAVTVSGILVGVLQSEGYYEDAAGYEQLISEFLTTFDAGASDSYGSAEPQLYAYGIFDPDFAPTEAETVQAIATRIVPGSEEKKFPPPGRNILIFRTAFAGQRWTITGLLIGGDPFSLAQFLDPTSQEAEQVLGNVFQFWSPWEGAQ